MIVVFFTNLPITKNEKIANLLQKFFMAITIKPWNSDVAVPSRKPRLKSQQKLFCLKDNKINPFKT